MSKHNEIAAYVIAASKVVPLPEEYVGEQETRVSYRKYKARLKSVAQELMNAVTEMRNGQ